MHQLPLPAEFRFGAAAAFVVAYCCAVSGPMRGATCSQARPSSHLSRCWPARTPPESARWLLSKGRVEQADAAVKKVFGPQYSVADLPAEPEVKTSSITVFQKPYLRRTIFVTVF